MLPVLVAPRDEPGPNGKLHCQESLLCEAVDGKLKKGNGTTRLIVLQVRKMFGWLELARSPVSA